MRELREHCTARGQPGSDYRSVTSTCSRGCIEAVHADYPAFDGRAHRDIENLEHRGGAGIPSEVGLVSPSADPVIGIVSTLVLAAELYKFGAVEDMGRLPRAGIRVSVAPLATLPQLYRYG